MLCLYVEFAVNSYKYRDVQILQTWSAFAEISHRTMHQRRALGIFFIALLATAHAISKVSVVVETVESTDVSTGNVTVQEQRRLQFTATDADHTARDLQIGSLFYDIDCDPPQAPYNSRLTAFASHSNQLFVHDVCTFQSAAAVNASSIPLGQPIPPDSIHSIEMINGGQRRLLSPVLAAVAVGAWVGIGVAAAIHGDSPVCAMSFGLFGCDDSNDGP